MSAEKNQKFLLGEESSLTKESYAEHFTRICESCGLKSRHSNFWMAATKKNEEGRALIIAHNAKFPPKVIMEFIKEDLERSCQHTTKSLSYLDLLDRILVEELSGLSVITPTYQKRLDVQEMNKGHMDEYLDEIWCWYQKHAMKQIPSLPRPI